MDTYTSLILTDMKSPFKNLSTAALLVSTVVAGAQSPENWFNLDPVKDKIAGVGTERIYAELLNGKEGAPVIVAIIDSGVDAEHEDLAEVMWVNEDEIADNGIDDDGNGYVDDVHGWNFIGGRDGRNVGPDNLEIARIYGKLRDRFADVNPQSLSKKERKKYDRYKELETTVEEKRSGAEKQFEQYTAFAAMVDFLQEEIGEDFDADELAAYTPTDERGEMAKAFGERLLSTGNPVPQIREEITEALGYFESQFKYMYDPDFDSREIVGDDYANSRERGYGNNDVEGPDAFHGTHVAGIVGAVRGNGIGMDGVADNVQIMSIRAVPDGDERDKDVANAIRYAVDNGAKVVNMSFGKGYSWDKEVVDEAVKYADKNDVLLVHAAGNSAQDNDATDNFPSAAYERKGFLKFLKKKYPDNWIEVGALDWKPEADAVARFSNYGKTNVDIFSPGVDIYSTAPDNEYQKASGTSMASPVTAGVAALIRSYFPELEADEVKDIILESGTKQIGRMVKIPGDDTLVDFGDLSKTGAMLNAYNAVKLAQKETGRPGGVLANGKIPRA